ncbi:MAG TPA: hypothetical protein VFG95_04805 [Nitrospiria bacterium]|nr:hypothetical protein [Nitrospiria bacterium]
MRALAENRLLSLNAHLMALENRTPAEEREESYRGILRECDNLKASAEAMERGDVLALLEDLEEIVKWMRKEKSVEDGERIGLHYRGLGVISLMIRCHLRGEKLPNDVLVDLRRQIERLKRFGTPGPKLGESSVREPKQIAGKRFVLRKGIRHA